MINEEKPLEDKEEFILDNRPSNSGNFQSEDIYKEMINPKDSLKMRNIVKEFDDGSSFTIS